MDTLNAEIDAFLAAPETQTLTAALRLLRQCQGALEILREQLAMTDLNRIANQDSFDDPNNKD